MNNLTLTVLMVLTTVFASNIVIAETTSNNTVQSFDRLEKPFEQEINPTVQVLEIEKTVMPCNDNTLLKIVNNTSKQVSYLAYKFTVTMTEHALKFVYILLKQLIH